MIKTRHLVSQDQRTKHMMERILLKLNEPEDALMWLSAFKAKARCEKKADIEESSDGRQRDYQITDLFISKCGIEAQKKLSSLVAPREIESMKFQEIYATLTAYLKPTERLVVAERTMFLSTSQDSEESESDYLARLREAARYCKFEALKTSNEPEAELIRLRFIAGLKDKEEKLKLLDALRVNDRLSVEELLQTIQYILR